MKKILFLLTLSTAAFGEGVSFIQGNLKTVFDGAKAANKAVFIEIFSPTCHVCASFVPTFENGNVGQFYNQRFVSYRLDVNSQEAQAFLNKQHLFVPSLPLLLYFDKDVNLLHAVNVNNSPENLVAAAGNALNPPSRAASYRSRYQAGERDPNFLIEYAYFSRIVRDTLGNLRAVSDYIKTQPKSAYTSNINFLVLQKLVTDTDNALFQYFIAHLPAYEKANGVKPVRDVAENIIMSTLFSSRAAEFSPEKVRTLGGYLGKIGLDKRTVDNRTLVPELTALLRARQPAPAVLRANAYLSGPAGPKEALFLAKFVTDRTTDAAALAAASGWLSKFMARPGIAAADKADLAKQLVETRRKAGK